MRPARHMATLLAALTLGCGGRNATSAAEPAPGGATGAESSRAALWSKHVGPGVVSGVAFDAAANLVAVGTIQGNFDASLGGGPGDKTRTDAFVAAFDHAGNLRWLHRWTSSGGTAAATYAAAVTVNDAGVWVLGTSWAAVVDLGDGTVSLPESGQNASVAFVAHYTVSGALVSSAPLAVPAICQTSPCDPSWLAFDDAGSVYWVTAVVPSSSSSGEGQELLTKCDPQGDLLWSMSLPQGAGSGGLAVSGSGMIAVPGTYALTVYGPDGSQRWSRPFQRVASNGPVAFDSAGDVIVGGSFSGAIDLGGPTPLQSPGSPDAEPMFLVKYDASGKYLWSHAYGSTPRAQSYVRAIGVASNQDVLFTGGFAGAVDFGTGAYQTNSDSEDIGSHDVFLARLGSDGGGQWSTAFGGYALGDAGWCLAAAPDGRVAMGGLFDRTIDFGNGSFTSIADFGSQWGPAGDGFVAVFEP
jgi:hypothetical protein